MTIIIKIVPKKAGRVIMNPYLLTILVLATTYISIYFAYGVFDNFILETTEQAANQLSKGRQELWLEGLKAVNYNFNDYFLYGAGVGQVISKLQSLYGYDRVLLHNDMLSFLLEFGFIFYMLFIITLFRQKNYYQIVMAINLAVLLFTDNIVMYTHIMITYFLIQSQFQKEL
jgi:hypothetical protein